MPTFSMLAARGQLARPRDQGRDGPAHTCRGLAVPTLVLADGPLDLSDVGAHVGRMDAPLAGAGEQEVAGIQSLLHLRGAERNRGVARLPGGPVEQRGVHRVRSLTAGDRVAHEAPDDLMGVAEGEVESADELVGEMAGRAPE